MNDAHGAETPRLPLLLAAKEAVRLICIVADELAEQIDHYGSSVGLLRSAANDLAAAVALHEGGPTLQEELREALLVALADLHPDVIRGARRVMRVVNDALARPRRIIPRRA